MRKHKVLLKVKAFVIQTSEIGSSLMEKRKAMGLYLVF